MIYGDRLLGAATIIGGPYYGCAIQSFWFRPTSGDSPNVTCDNGTQTREGWNGDDMTDAMDDVLNIVGGHFGVSAKEILSGRRTRKILPARHVPAYLAHRLLGLTMKDIGARLGGRDYTSIQMYCRVTERRVQHDDCFKKLLGELERLIRNQHLGL